MVYTNLQIKIREVQVNHVANIYIHIKKILIYLELRCLYYEQFHHYRKRNRINLLYIKSIQFKMNY